jgi:hypothetical protein
MSAGVSLVIACAGFAAMAAHADGATPHATPEILVTALRGMQWQVRHGFAEAVGQLRFASSPPARGRRPGSPADQGFEIVATDRGDGAPHNDCAMFIRSVARQ